MIRIISKEKACVKQAYESEIMVKQPASESVFPGRVFGHRVGDFLVFLHAVAEAYGLAGHLHHFQIVFRVAERHDVFHVNIVGLAVFKDGVALGVSSVLEFKQVDSCLEGEEGF
jgi:hypothetical protein